MKHRRLPLSIDSFAKINLYLRILNKRKDNFHDLSTLFCRIDLKDTIILRERNDQLIKIKCANSRVPKDKRNLCYRAAALLRQEFNLKYGVEIEIKKRIPVGAGLGGGSSNAASVLLGLNKFWKLGLPAKKLMKLAEGLGSDVAFFLSGAKFALGSGRGDKITLLPSLRKLKLWLILVYPGIHVSTPLIYREFDEFRRRGAAFSQLTRPKQDVKMLLSELAKKGPCFDPELLFNSLEPVAGSIYPEIYQVKKAFYGIGLEKVMMSGSGAAVFAVCDSQRRARYLREVLLAKHKTWQIFVSLTA